MGQRDFLLDTNVIPAFLSFKRGKPTKASEQFKKHFIQLQNDSRLCVSVMTIGEIEYGLKVAPMKDIAQQQEVRDALSEFPAFDVNENVSQNYAALRARLFEYCAPKKKKQRSPDKKRIEEWIDPATSKELKIQENDLWIASVAMTYNMVLVTHDKMDAIKHIAGVDVEFEDWLT